MYYSIIFQLADFLYKFKEIGQLHIYSKLLRKLDIIWFDF